MMSSSPSSSSDANRLCIQGHSTSSRRRRRSGFMMWLSKIFRGTPPGLSNRHRPRFIEEDMYWRGPLRPVDNQPKSDNEDLDRAIALSLAEDVRKRNGYNGCSDNDEDLARGIQESLNMTTSRPYVPPQHKPRGYRTCGGCKHEIGHGHYLSCMGTFWHPQCFCCYACHQPIRETEFSLSGSHPYHKLCYKELHHPKCDVCHQFIPINRDGLIEYRAHPFWNQKYCPSHEHDNTPRCCSCERLESRNTSYISLGDGRMLCLECLDSAIMDTGDCQPLYHSIRDYYEGMYMKIDQQIPMLLVERQALNEAMEGEKDGRHHMPETRGLCLSEEQTVSSIHKRPRIGGNRILDMRTHPQKLVRKCEVTAILVLYGLPRLLTGAILVHELMHGWLRLKGYRNLRPEVEEGICQVLSHMWLESEVLPRSMPSSSSSNYVSSSSSSSYNPWSKKGGQSDIEKKLGEFFMHQITNDISSAYGEGFRRANSAVNRYGLRRTLDHIHKTSNFPL